MPTRSLPARLIPPLAAYKLSLGLIAFAATWRDAAGKDPGFPYTLYGLLQVAFGATAALLLLGGREDRRALALGSFFLVTATAWSNGPLDNLIARYPGAWLLALADAVETHAFLAFYLWLFVRDFPAPPSLAWRRRIQILVRLSAVTGGAFFGLSLLTFLARRDAGGALLDAEAAERGAGIVYTVVLSLMIAAFPALYWKSRAFQNREEQACVRAFLRNFFLAFGPALTVLALELFVKPFAQLMDANDRFRGVVVVISLLPTLSLPFTIPHAALVHRVLHVKLAARQALRYTLARWAALTLVTVPLAALVFYLYARRGSSLSDLFSGLRVLLLLAVASVGAAALYYRRTLLDAIDRRFFREQYDARQILTLLVERIRSIRDSPTLADHVSREIDLALHLEKASLLVLDLRWGTLADPRGRTRKLDASSPLALTLSNASDPLAIDLEDPQSPLLRLPEKERRWLEESGLRLLVPILARDGSLLGLIGLGAKRSGLPFLREDRQLLHAIASSAAWVLELEQQAKAAPAFGPGGGDPPDLDDTMPVAGPIAAEYAKECPHCGALHPSYTVLCAVDSRRLERSRVPYVLPGRFRFEKRIGTGGMGVVYAGSDLSLGRKVAIKTLRRMSPEDGMRLRREAKTAAAVAHPHLAAVFGFETWKSMPMLVMELLEEGTLAERIPGKLSPRETVELGIRMADALARLHSAEILHRDIKPSNIGYTRDAVPKLMDFGIAGVIFELRQEEEELAAMADREKEEEGYDPALIPDVAVWETGSGSDVRHRFAGTLSYLSPEAVRGHPADASFDLWSLSIVLYECLLGRKIFTGTANQVVERIRAGRVPDFSQVCPEHGEALGELFRDALHPSLSRRPATAAELRERLEEVREALA